MSPKNPPQNELFRRGASSYLDALTAIAAFRGEVQDMCAEVYKRHEEDLATQMGLIDDAYKPLAEPTNGPKEIGILRPAQPRCNFCLYLGWDEDERGGVTIRGAVRLGVYLPKRKLRDEILERFRQQRPGCRVERHSSAYCLVLYETLKDLSSAHEVLDALVLEWLGYCRSIGGLKLTDRKTA